MNSNQSKGLSGRSLLAVSMVALAGLVSACSTPGNGEQTYGVSVSDAAFGDSVRAARARQTIDMDAGSKHAETPGTDGTSAALALENYHKSFKEPAPTINVLGIGNRDSN